MKLTPFPFRTYFYIGAPYNFPTDTILTIYYKGYHFGHTWQLGPDWGAHAGKWTFNRGTVAINNDYYMSKHYHESLDALLDYLKDTFVEKE